ncbi:dCTP deaminase [Nocardia aurantia]|uniref:dCTP deaminase n=1 Tax=Nocardia aurantia TaxID=2585199 RepID=UPI0018861F99|nr:dCTP deaminase [Nocardia aurantia]
MILSKPTIQRYLENGSISVRPASGAGSIRPFGIRIHLSDEILRPRSKVIDLGDPAQMDDLYERESIAESPLVLEPGDFVLGATVEAFKVDPHLACKLDGRSTLARLGLMIHCTADTIDNNTGSHRAVVLELKNISSFTMKIPFGYGIGMLTFFRGSEPVDPEDEQSQYDDQLKVTGPNLAFPAPLLGREYLVQS